MKLKLFLQNWEISKDTRGFTLIELLVTLGIVSIIASLALSGVLQMTNSFHQNMTRTRLQANLRDTMDLMSTNIRQAGEGLGQAFPSILYNDNGANGLTLRRNLLPVTMTLCQNVSIGATSLTIAQSGLPESVCNVSMVAPNLPSWSTFRTDQGGTVPVFLYDKSTKTGTFVDYTGQSSSGTQVTLTVSPATRAYNRITTVIYVLEELRFQRNAANTMQVFRNGNTTAQDVAYNVTVFSIIAHVNNGGAVTQFNTITTSNIAWQNIKSIEVNLAADDSYRGAAITKTSTGFYFPRSVLSE